MTATFPARTLSVSIRCAPERVYGYASDPRNLPRWVGFFRSVTAAGDRWLADTPGGQVAVRFVAANELGVLDHVVTLPSGDQLRNSMRVIANGDGSELLFTLLQRPGVSDEAFAADAALVERDLAALRAILEADQPS